MLNPKFTAFPASVISRVTLSPTDTALLVEAEAVTSVVVGLAVDSRASVPLMAGLKGADPERVSAEMVSMG